MLSNFIAVSILQYIHIYMYAPNDHFVKFKLPRCYVKCTSIKLGKCNGRLYEIHRFKYRNLNFFIKHRNIEFIGQKTDAKWNKGLGGEKKKKNLKKQNWWLKIGRNMVRWPSTNFHLWINYSFIQECLLFSTFCYTQLPCCHLPLSYFTLH